MCTVLVHKHHHRREKSFRKVDNPSLFHLLLLDLVDPELNATAPLTLWLESPSPSEYLADLALDGGAWAFFLRVASSQSSWSSTRSESDSRPFL